MPARLFAASAAALALVACGSSAPAARSSAQRLGPTVAAPTRVLFDDTKAETAGNADWIVSTAMPDPAAEDASPRGERDWTGALSAWGVALERTGAYRVTTLAPSGAITYGDASNAQDLSRYDVFVLPEPNVLFSAAERTAILAFVHHGGGLFMISDHDGSDRNGDGVDSVAVLNELMGSGVFGFSIDRRDIRHDDPDVLGPSDEVLDGPFGRVTATIVRGGTTATLRGSAARGEVYTTGSTAGGDTNAAFVTAGYGSGRVAFWGDSSPVDDGTGQPGNVLYDGWDDANGSDGVLALNATAWLGRAPA